MSRVKKQEANDIVKNMVPKLAKLGYEIQVDSATEKTKNLRGDIWLKDDDDKIIGLVEAKTVNAVLGDSEWKDAMRQGKKKSNLENLPYYIVSNTLNYTRYYNSITDNEIKIDGRILTDIVTKETACRLLASINEETDDMVNKKQRMHTEAEFRKTLNTLSDIFRSEGIEKDERIDPTISFVIIKYISELESEERTLPEYVELWDEFDKSKDMKSKFSAFITNISTDEKNIYYFFNELLIVPESLSVSSCKLIYDEISKYAFHGGMLFDIFGMIYESFASKKAKQEFGEFYTRRHITSSVSNIMFRNINSIHQNMKICDPACGTGGFLTDAFKKLSSLNITELEKEYLRKRVFYGYDSNSKSIIRTKMNMFLAGDGHNNIHHVNDSLFFDESINWKNNNFDYILANPPMGNYSGSANINDFKMTNNKKMEQLFLERIIQSLKPNGWGAVIVNDGPLENPSNKEFRKKLLEYIDVKAVVSLNKFVFAPYTKEKTYLLIFSKKLAKIDEYGQEIYERQKDDILHYIVDFDGFSNNDKRYKTKYNDDIPEMEEVVINYLNSPASPVSRLVNENEESVGLSGYKYKTVTMDEIEQNDYVLASEFYLRESATLSVSEWISEVNSQLSDIKGLIDEIL